MTTQLRLNEYPTNPLYNIKAVVQATGISPSTLRAWERRYQMCRPERSESGYRLYSERDIIVIRWLKAQVDAGMAISQAVSWYDTLVQESENGVVLLPIPESGVSILGNGDTPRPARRAEIRDFPSLCGELLSALINFDETRAEAIVSEAFALYSVEEVGEKLFVPVLVEVGERWHRRELGVTTEHFATNYILQRLATLLHAMPNHTGAPLIWVGCAPGELHEIGAVLLALYLRRAGYGVRYLGQNIPGDDLEIETRRHMPAMMLFSATTVKTAQELAGLTARLVQISPGPIIGYGGQIFNARPELRTEMTGVYMGATAEAAVRQVQELLGAKPLRKVA